MYKEIDIKWEDHWFEDTCVTPESIKNVKPMVHSTRGYLLHENRRMLCVAHTVQEDGQGCEVTYIMKKNIKYRSDKEQ